MSEKYDALLNGSVNESKSVNDKQLIHFRQQFNKNEKLIAVMKFVITIILCSLYH